MGHPSIHGFRDSPETNPSGSIYSGRLCCDDVQITGTGTEAIATFTITARQLMDAAVAEMLWTDQDVQRGVRPEVAGKVVRELSLSKGYPDTGTYVFNADSADDMTEKLLHGQRLFVNPLVWNMRPGSFDAYHDEHGRKIYIYDGRIYAFLFSRGASPNATFDQSGSGFPGNGLHYCHDSEVIKVLLENGIDSDLQAGRPGSSFTGHTAFELHLHHYIFDKESRELQIAKLIGTKARTNRVDPQIEFSICRACGRRQMPNTCEEISSVVDVSDARIFTPKGYVEKKDGDVSVARCYVLTAPECKNSACYWRARLKQLTKHSTDTDMLYDDSEDL